MTPDIRALLGACFLPLIVACGAGGLPAVTGEPAPDPNALASELRASSIPGSPQQVNFAWTLEEGGSRARGRGVVRAEAPDRIRLDLFGPRGETYLIAALVEDEYRLPTAVAAPVALPSPALLWAAMGVFDPPPGAELSSANTRDDGAEVRFTAPNGEIYLFDFVGAAGTPRLVSLERATGRGVIESVTLRRDAAGVIQRADYRDWSAFRTLTLEVESIRQVDAFPGTIWRPDAEAR